MTRKPPMLRPWRPRDGRRAAALAAFAAIASAALPAAAQASALDLYYERAVMSAADQNCHLFGPELAAALASAQAQARGAALRSGAGAATVDLVAERARRRMAQTPCGSPDIAKAAGRVRAAFEGYSRLQRMNFPGDTAGWAADRAVSRDGLRWNLSQTTDLGADRLTFGLAVWRGQTGLLAVAGLQDGVWPYAARLVLRDAARAPQPCLGLTAASTSARNLLAARMPPRSGTVSILAEAREPAQASLLPGGADLGVAFRFPASAAATLAALDPRETVAVELLFATPSGRDEVRTAYIELGDFAAGRAFLGAVQR